MLKRKSAAAWPALKPRKTALEGYRGPGSHQRRHRSRACWAAMRALPPICYRPNWTPVTRCTRSPSSSRTSSRAHARHGTIMRLTMSFPGCACGRTSRWSEGGEGGGARLCALPMGRIHAQTHQRLPDCGELRPSRLAAGIPQTLAPFAKVLTPTRVIYRPAAPTTGTAPVTPTPAAENPATGTYPGS